MPSSKVAYKRSIINQNQGGGNKKMGLYPSVATPVNLAIQSQKNSVKFFMKIQKASGTFPHLNNIEAFTANIINNSGGGIDPGVINIIDNIEGGVISIEGGNAPNAPINGFTGIVDGGLDDIGAIGGIGGVGGVGGIGGIGGIGGGGGFVSF